MEEEKLLYFMRKNFQKACLCLIFICTISDLNIVLAEEIVFEKALENVKNAEKALKNLKIAEPDTGKLREAELAKEIAGENKEKHLKAKNIEKIIAGAKILKESESYKAGEKVAKNVLAESRDFKFKEASGDIVTSKGVDLYEMSNRYISEFNKGRKNEKEKLSGLFVLISSSLPTSSIKQIARDVKKVGGTLLFRGMIEGSMMRTAEFVLNLNKEGVKAAIHPKIFEMLNVEVVPCYVLIKGGVQENKYEVLHDKIIGNVSLEYALNKFKEKGDTKEEAARLLAKLRGAA